MQYQQPQLPPGAYGAPPPAQRYGMSPGAAASTGISPIDAIKFLTTDKEWTSSLLFACIFQFIPIVGPIALMGWFAEIHQRLARNHPRPIPKLDFSDFGSYIGRGVAPFVVGLVVAIPFVIIYFVAYFAFVVGGAVIGAAVGEPLLMFVFLGFFGLFMFCFALFFSVFQNAAATRAELTEDIGKGLAFGAIMQYGKVTWLTVLIKNFLYGFVAFAVILVGLLLCGIGVYPAAILVQVGSLHLRYQIYRDFLAKGGTPIDVAAPKHLVSELVQGPHPAAYQPPPGAMPQAGGGGFAPPAAGGGYGPPPGGGGYGPPPGGGGYGPPPGGGGYGPPPGR